MIRHSLCPLCSSGKIIPFIRCRDHLVSKEYFELFRCRECSFVFTQDCPEEQDIGRYYESEEYISHSDISKGLFNKVYLLVREIMLRRKVRIVRRSSRLKKGVLLDIGCGTGYFANAMARAGWNVTGIEVNKKARDYAISRFGLDVIDSKEAALLATGSFDVVTLWHVLEHFHDPFKYFKEIGMLLKPGGHCFVALPNNASFDAEFYREHWAAYDVPRHLWHFSPDSFRYFSEKTGFKYTGMSVLPFDVFYISALSEKNMGKKYPFIRGLLRGMNLYLRSLPDKEKQSSVIYLIKK
jgi:SAM-dependent methyltransferase